MEITMPSVTRIAQGGASDSVKTTDDTTRAEMIAVSRSGPATSRGSTVHRLIPGSRRRSALMATDSRWGRTA